MYLWPEQLFSDDRAFLAYLGLRFSVITTQVQNSWRTYGCINIFLVDMEK